MRKSGFSDESGSALIAVIFIGILLVTASAFLLSAVGNNSRNSTDVLSETKAYYAAESGLQASINVLRFNEIGYSRAALSGNLAIGSIPDNPTLGLPYDPATNKVEMTETAKYAVQVVDPDASRPYTFSTSGMFTQITGTALKDDGRTLCIPDCTAGTRTEITFHNAASSNVTFPLTANPEIGRFSVTYAGGGVGVPANIELKIQFQLSSPRSATRTIKAWTGATSAGAPISIDFSTSSFVPTYSLLRTTIQVQPTTTVCAPDAGCQADLISVSIVDGEKRVYVHVEPIEPSRLIVKSTGYGPGGAKKTLEGVLQKNFFDDLASSSALALLGPSSGMVFDAGTGGPHLLWLRWRLRTW
jgi:hypothetical protein